MDQVLEFIDDFMVNAYFSNLELFEGTQQKIIKELRFKMNQAFHSSKNKIGENYKMQLQESEKEFFCNTAKKLSEIRKDSISGIIYILNPFLTIYNDEFAKYLVESDVEDNQLISFLNSL
jgi:hypothetical protein